MRLVTADDLRVVLDYNPETGWFVWRKGNFKGRRAGCQHWTGYRFISRYGRTYLEHRVAWLYVYGEWPSGDLDHVNLDKTDNRICNLRQSNDSMNQANRRRDKKMNTSGRKGVCWNFKSKKWQAGIKHQGKSYHLGLFDDLDAAAAAYARAAQERFGEFARTE